MGGGPGYTGFGSLLVHAPDPDTRDGTAPPS